MICSALCKYKTNADTHNFYMDYYLNKEIFCLYFVIKNMLHLCPYQMQIWTISIVLFFSCTQNKLPQPLTL